MDPQPDEYNLALRAREGDREALAELVERARLRLFALAYSELRHYEDAQDAVASAFFQICLHVKELRDPGRVQAWMNSIVRNQAHMLRRGAGRVGGPLEETLVGADETLPSLLRLDIERALDQIPQAQATALRLFYLEEWPVRRIARRVGRPEGTIKRWLHLGRRHLATHMEEYAPMAAPTPTSTPSPIAALIHTSLEAELIQQITSALQAGGYTTRPVIPTNPFALTDALKDCQVVILDEWIEGRSALELVLHLKAHPETQSLPICLLCESPSEFTTFACFIAGIKRVVDKSRADPISSLSDPIEGPAHRRFWMSFTESAKRVIFLAQSEANRLGEKEIVSPEHLLLGLVHDGNTAAAHILERLGVAPGLILAEVERQVLLRPSITEPGEMQLDAEAKHAIDLAADEAKSLTIRFLGTQHLLVGLLRAGDNLPARILTALGVELESVRREIPLIQVETMASGGETEGKKPSSEPVTAGRTQ